MNFFWIFLGFLLVNFLDFFDFFFFFFFLETSVKTFPLMYHLLM